VSLTNVWIQTNADGLVRADQVLGIEAHMTAGLRGTSPHWLLDVVLATSVGSGVREGWTVMALHRTLAQTTFPPGDASVALARLLARLDAISPAGLIGVEKKEGAKERAERDGADVAAGGFTASAGGIRFRFVPFQAPVPDDRTDAEYL
jgi:hypothetical protein